jgi:tetratricopeptide (TPR) repeat protein
VQRHEQVEIDRTEIHASDNHYHETSLVVMQATPHGGAMTWSRFAFLLVVGCAAAAPRVDVHSRAETQERHGEFSAARATLGGGIERARAANDRRTQVRLAAELARVWSHEAFARNRGYEEGLAAARAAQQAARAERDPHALAIALDAEGMLHYGRLLWAGASDFSRPRADFAAAIAAFGETADHAGLAEATFHLGLSHEQAGDKATAAQHYKRAEDLGARAGSDVVVSYTARHLAGLAEERGDLVAARLGFERSLDLRERAGYQRLVPYAMMAIAALDVREGKTERALVSVRRALAMAERIGNEAMLLWAHAAVAEALPRSAATERQHHLERALAIAEQAQIPIAIVATARATADLVEPGDPGRAAQLRAQAEQAERAGRAVTLK